MAPSSTENTCRADQKNDGFANPHTCMRLKLGGAGALGGLEILGPRRLSDSGASMRPGFQGPSAQDTQAPRLPQGPGILAGEYNFSFPRRANGAFFIFQSRKIKLGVLPARGNTDQLYLWLLDIMLGAARTRATSFLLLKNKVGAPVETPAPDANFIFRY